MGSFVVKEDIESYKFALSCFEEFFQAPDVVMTDQDPALISAISKNWDQTHHLFYLFHIYRNVQKKVAQYLGKKNEAFLKHFSYIQRIESINEFEKEWEEFEQLYSAKHGENDNIETNEESFHEILASKEEEISEEIESFAKHHDNDKNKIGNYLIRLYKFRKSWAKCYTFRHFGAGYYFLLFRIYSF